MLFNTLQTNKSKNLNYITVVNERIRSGTTMISGSLSKSIVDRFRANKLLDAVARGKIFLLFEVGVPLSDPS